MVSNKPFTFKNYAGRILGREDPRRDLKNGGPIPIALVYPNSYAVGMSSLGFQTVFRLLARQEVFQCERFFLYGPPFDTRSLTLETRKELSTFPYIAFSVSFELDYLNIVAILKTAGIPVKASERGENAPVVIFGGVTTFYNPSVLAPVADGILIGEAEELVPRFARVAAGNPRTNTDRKQILHALSSIPGCFVPSLLPSPAAGTIKRRHANITTLQPATSVLVSPGAHFGMFLVEVGRGCGRGCRFCAAGHVYTPFRCWSAETVVQTVKKYAHPGDKIGLVGAALSDFRNLETLVEKLDGYHIGLSSLRADKLSAGLLSVLKQSGIQSVTLAPEAGTERMRRVINKQLPEESVLEAAARLSSAGIADLKLYFMIGLPFETEKDLAGIVTLVAKVAVIFKGRSVHTSLNAFVPKPFTPFQWAAMETESRIKKKRKWLTRELRRLKNVTVAFKSSRKEVMQGILSTGGPATGHALCEQGPHFLSGQKSVLDWLHREKGINTHLPWDFIDCGLDKERLWKSWQAAKKSAGRD